MRANFSRLRAYATPGKFPFSEDLPLRSSVRNEAGPLLRSSKDLAVSPLNLLSPLRIKQFLISQKFEICFLFPFEKKRLCSHLWPCLPRHSFIAAAGDRRELPPDPRCYKHRDRGSSYSDRSRNRDATLLLNFH